MCRWLAYSGSEVSLDTLLMAPEHSILDQSRHAERTEFEINGDGFGVGWYGSLASPGVFHDIRPAWNDRNLQSLAAHVKSSLFMAHVRATTGSPVSRSNCHPFVHENWLFVHNGRIGGFEELRHALDCQIAPAIYGKRIGSTDTETMFELALTLGLAEDPPAGIRRMIERVELEREKQGVNEPFHMTVAVSDGKRLWAFRHASDLHDPSLFHSVPGARLRGADGSTEPLGSEAVIVVSEPLDREPGNWVEVPPESQLVVEGGDVRVSPLFPEAA
jgi:glutamine amidotransferase